MIIAKARLPTAKAEKLLSPSQWKFCEKKNATLEERLFCKKLKCTTECHLFTTYTHFLLDRCKGRGLASIKQKKKYLLKTQP